MDIVPEKSPEDIYPDLNGDSFWYAYKWENNGQSMQLPSDGWEVDVMLWEDGRARLRNMEDRIAINSPDSLRLSWELSGDQLYLYDRGSERLMYQGELVGAEIKLEFFGGTLYLKEKLLPTVEGELYSPAELLGTWLMVSGETEGSSWEAMPGTFVSLVFQLDWTLENPRLLVDSDQGDFYGFLPEGFRGLEAFVLDDFLYEGCGNESWSVRLGLESPLDANGYPVNTEYYLTLLDEDTLLQQSYFAIDGSPRISYQVFKRALPEISSWAVQEGDLQGSDWECISFVDAAGRRRPLPPGYSSFYMHLDTDRQSFIRWEKDNGDSYSSYGNYMLGVGGALLICGEDSSRDWFAGAIRIDSSGTPAGIQEEYELYLHFANGTLMLRKIDGSGGENHLGGEDENRPGGGSEGAGSEESMNTLEYNAFSAPAGSLLVLYDETYVDFDHFTDILFYDISDGPNSCNLILSSVADGTRVWLEDHGSVVGDFGTLHAGDSVKFRVGLPNESSGLLLCFTVNGEDYHFDLFQGNLGFYDGWSYIIED
ncbi:MAG: hypothetical protein Q4B50_08405 [Bacillota bacterium]|nr:hypothetical protein [Bacillota bacterium]